jgi:PEGA domain
MSRSWPLVGWVLALTLVTGMMSGCVDRRFVIESDPQNAIVTLNNKVIGATPADVQFTYYGTYRIVFDHDGFQRLVVDECVSMPWYEYFPLEFIVENVLPFTIRDIHYIRKPLEPMILISPDQTFKRAQELREKGKAIYVPEAGSTLPASPPCVPAPGPVMVPAVPPPGLSVVQPLPPNVPPPMPK